MIYQRERFDGMNEKLQCAVEGNLLENLDLVADPHKNFVVIMKDGKVYKNTMK